MKNAGLPGPAVVVVLVLLPVPVLADGLQVDVGPIQAVVDASDVPDCAIPVPPVPCALGRDDAGTPTPTDDTLYAYHAISRVRVDADAAPLPSEEVAIEPSSILHPASPRAHGERRARSGLHHAPDPAARRL